MDGCETRQSLRRKSFRSLYYRLSRTTPAAVYIATYSLAWIVLATVKAGRFMFSEYSLFANVIRNLTCGFSSERRLLINQLCSVVVPGYDVISISTRVFPFDKYHCLLVCESAIHKGHTGTEYEVLYCKCIKCEIFRQVIHQKLVFAVWEGSLTCKIIAKIIVVISKAVLPKYSLENSELYGLYLYTKNSHNIYKIMQENTRKWFGVKFLIYRLT